ncbi:ABC transporter ATP-binding protein [Chitinimonas naiadis]
MPKPRNLPTAMPPDQPQPPSPALLVRQLRGEDNGPYSLTIPPGQCVLLSGPSGVGKSRLLRMIADLEPGTGEVRLGTETRDSMPAPAWRRRVCYVAAESGWWADSVREHMAAPQAVAALLSLLGLPDSLLDAPVAQLSTGERQRLALLRAGTQRPQFLLLDEPTSALDEASALQVESLLGRWQAEGMGLLVVSHNQAQIGRLGGPHWRMHRDGMEAVTP